MKAKSLSTVSRQPAKSIGLGAPAPSAQAKGLFAPSSDEVASRAYQNYQKHGSAHGHDVQDWLQAEAELVAHCQLA